MHSLVIPRSLWLGSPGHIRSRADVSERFCLLFHQQLCLLEHGPLTSLSQLDALSFAEGGGGHSWPDVHAERRLRERRAAGGERAFSILCSVGEEPPLWTVHPDENALFKTKGIKLQRKIKAPEVKLM